MKQGFFTEKSKMISIHRSDGPIVRYKTLSHIIANTFLVVSVLTALIVILGTDIVPLTRGPQSRQSVYFLFLLSVITILFGATLIRMRNFFESRKSKSHSLSKVNLIVSILTIITLFAFQTAVIYAIAGYMYPTPTDVDNMTGYALNMEGSGAPTPEYSLHYASTYDEYFSLYPNNIVLAVILRLIVCCARIVGVPPVFAMSLCSAISVDIASIAGIIMFRFIFENSRMVVIGGVLSAILASFAPIAANPYSDTFAAGTAALSLLFYIKVIDEKGGRFIALCIGLVFALGLGIAIKPQVAVIAVAIICHALLLFIEKAQCGKYVFSVFTAVALAALVSFSLGAVSRICYDGKIDASKTCGWQHILMMGLNPVTNGDVSYEDIAYSRQFASVDERAKGDLTEAKRRFTAMVKNHTILQFYIKKLLLTFSCGDFNCFMGERDVPVEEERGGDLFVLRAIRSVFLGKSKRVSICDIEQFCWIIIIILIPFAYFYLRSHMNNHNKLSFLFIVYLGVVMFQLVFETRTRYLFCFFPLFITLTLAGFRWLINCDLITRLLNRFSNASETC